MSLVVLCLLSYGIYVVLSLVLKGYITEHNKNWNLVYFEDQKSNDQYNTDIKEWCRWKKDKKYYLHEMHLLTHLVSETGVIGKEQSSSSTSYPLWNTKRSEPLVWFFILTLKLPGRLPKGVIRTQDTMSGLEMSNT